MLVAGCGSSAASSQPQPSQQQTQPSQNQTQSSQQSDSPELVPIPYSQGQIDQILQLANQDKIQTPYVPRMMLDGDAFESAVGSFTLKYKKMTVNESDQSALGGGVILHREDVQLHNSVHAQWIQVQGKAGPSFWVLYLKQENTYITISATDGTKNNQTESIAESLTPLQKWQIEWQTVSRLNLVQGKIISIDKTADELNSLTLQVEKNIKTSMSPVADPNFPFKIGSSVSITFNEKLGDNGNIDPKVGDEVILDVAQYVTTSNQKPFWGSHFSYYYYQKDGKFFDSNGKQFQQ